MRHVAAPLRSWSWFTAVVMLSTCVALSCQSSTPTGIRVEIQGEFLKTAGSLRLTVKVDGGFKGDGNLMPRAGVTLSYPNGDLVVDLTSNAQHPFTTPLIFRLETNNQTELHFDADVVVFDGTGATIASDSQDRQALPVGGEAKLTLVLKEDHGGTNTDPTLIDLAKVAPDGKVLAAKNDAAMATVAVCNLDGNGMGDLVIGVPTGNASATGPTGAVYIAFDAAGTLDLAGNTNGREIHIYGVFGGDQLGASVACLKLDSDLLDDLVIGAPGAYDDASPRHEASGRVYVIRGRTTLRQSGFDLSKHEADIEWVGAGANARLGDRLLAAKMQQNHSAILIAAPGEGTGIVHLMTVTSFPSTSPAMPAVLGGAVGHVTFSGIKPAAMAVGDLDGDGAAEGGSDVMLGDPGYPGVPNSPAPGAVYFFRNVDPTGTSAFTVGSSGALAPARTIIGTADKQAFGAALLAVELAGHPGPDLVVGAPGDSDQRGAAVVFEYQDTFFGGSAAPAMANPKWTFTGTAAGERFGATVASGRIGVADGAPLCFGAPGSVSGSTTAGAVYCFDRHPANGAMPTLAHHFLGAAADDHLGTAIAVGPINDDALADLVMLAPGLAAASSAPGTAYIRLAKP